MPSPASTSSSPTAAVARGKRAPKPNPSFPLQPGFKAAAPPAASKDTAPKQVDDEGGNDDDSRTRERLDWLEKKILIIEEEKKAMRGEIKDLRDRLEEAEWARKRLEDMVKEASWGEELEKLKEDAAAGKREQETLKKEVEKERRERESLKEELERERREPCPAPHTDRQRVTNDGQAGNAEQTRPPDSGTNSTGRRKCIVFTDSNGRDVTADSIRKHMPTETGDNYDITVDVAVRLDTAFYRVREGLLDVKDCIVLIDNVTNDVKGNWKHFPADPEETVRRIDLLRAALFAAGAATVIVCQVKPMRSLDVRLHNEHIHQYLKDVPGGYGVPTMVRMEYLRKDGLHIDSRYDSILDRNYAYALQGTRIPCPTPHCNFIPDDVRRTYYADFPRTTPQGNSNQNG